MRIVIKAATAEFEMTFQYFAYKGLLFPLLHIQRSIYSVHPLEQFKCMAME